MARSQEKDIEIKAYAVREKYLQEQVHTLHVAKEDLELQIAQLENTVQEIKRDITITDERKQQKLERDIQTTCQQKFEIKMEKWKEAEKTKNEKYIMEQIEKISEKINDKVIPIGASKR